MAVLNTFTWVLLCILVETAREITPRRATDGQCHAKTSATADVALTEQHKLSNS